MRIDKADLEVLVKWVEERTALVVKLYTLNPTSNMYKELSKKIQKLDKNLLLLAQTTDEPLSIRD
jgi:hypothetical protein